MLRFKITAIDPRSGKPVEGYLDGESREAVVLLAEKRGLKILSVELLGPPSASKKEDGEKEIEQTSQKAESGRDGAEKNPGDLRTREEHRTKRKHRAVIPAMPDPSIPITPMLDMTFQLLFFFIMTFRRPIGEETEVPFSLPPSDEAKAAVQGKEPPPQGDVPPKFEANLTVLLVSNPDGDLKRVEIKGTGAADSLVIPDDDIRNASKVGELLRKEMPQKLRLPFLAHFGEDKEQAKNREGINIKLQASAGIKWELVVLVIDACRAAANQVAGDPTKAVIALQKPVDQTGK